MSLSELEKIYFKLTPCVTKVIGNCKSVYLKVAYINIMFTLRYNDHQQ